MQRLYYIPVVCLRNYKRTPCAGIRLQKGTMTDGAVPPTRWWGVPFAHAQSACNGTLQRAWPTKVLACGPLRGAAAPV